MQILLTIILVVGLVIMNSTSRRMLGQLANVKQVPFKHLVYFQKMLQVLLATAGLFIASIIWGIDYKGMLLFFSSAFAIIGVALFAQWSLLSNITASVIIFFAFPARIGDRIRILDGDDSVQGELKEIGLFQIILVLDNGNIVSYPNNLLLQRPVVKLEAKLDEVIDSAPENGL